MKLIKPNFEIIENMSNEFLKKNNLFEHITIYLKAPTHVIVNQNGDVDYINDLNIFKNNFDAIVEEGSEELDSEEYVEHVYVTTNYKVLVDNFSEKYINNLLNIYSCEPTEYHERRYTVKFICDNEFINKLLMFKNFVISNMTNLNSINNELTFIIPDWCSDDIENPKSIYDKLYIEQIKKIEDTYFNLLKKWNNKIEDKRYKSGYKNNPWTPRQASNILPNSIKQEIIVSGFEFDWKKLLNLNTNNDLLYKLKINLNI